MVETLRHKKAFDYYYALGNKRSFKAVQRQFNVSNRTVARWSKAFNWQLRIQQRDVENAKEIERKTNSDIVNSKADYRKDIKESNLVLNALLNKIIIRDGDKIVGVNLEIETILDAVRVIQLKDLLMKSDLSLVGENIGEGDAGKAIGVLWQKLQEDKGD